MSSVRRETGVTVAGSGFSLVEFLVAMVLGLIIVGGAVSVYLASKRSLTEVEQVAGVSENGRFALQILNYAAKHVGFFGSARPPDIRLDAALGTVTGDCTGLAAAYDTNNSFFAVHTDSASVLGCIDDAALNTDVLVIKGVVPSPLYDADPDDPNAPRDGAISFPATLDSQTAYVISNSEGGLILDGADTAPDVREGSEFALGVAWPYRLQIFYVRADPATGFLSLSRKILAWDTGSSSMFIDTQDLVDGVENMRFLFGFDSGVDGDVDTVGNAVAVQAADAWDSVTSMQVFVLLRSQADDVNYTDEKTYTVGSENLTPGGNFRRVLLHSEMTLRNPRLVLRGGA